MNRNQWLPVRGWPEYEVSTMGVVRRGRRVLAPWVNTGGYPSVTLHVAPRRLSATVHRLVLEAFIGPAPKGGVCRHLNGNRSDNRLGNLRWGTSAENAADRAAHGTTIQGERASRSKLTATQVVQIRQLIHEKVPQRRLAARFGVSKSLISHIAAGRKWRHLETKENTDAKS